MVRDWTREDAEELQALALESWREGRRAAVEFNRQADSTLVWLVGLSAGAVVFGTQFSSHPSGLARLVSVAPWLVSLLIGIGARRRVAELMLEDRKASLATDFRLAAFHKRAIDDAKALSDGMSKLLENPTPESVKKLDKKAGRWMRACERAFAWGVIWARGAHGGDPHASRARRFGRMD